MPDRPNQFDGHLQSSGRYMISVFLHHSAARDGQTAALMLDMAVTGADAAVVQGDGA